MLQRESVTPLLLAPRIGQGLGEAADRKVRIDAHGSKSPLDQQDSRSLLQSAKSVSWVLTMDSQRKWVCTRLADRLLIHYSLVPTAA